MSNNKSIWDIIIEFLKKLFGSSSTDQSTITTTVIRQSESGKEKDVKKYLTDLANLTLKDMKTEAKEVVIAESAKLLLKHGQNLLGMTEAQKEYVIYVGLLKSIENLDSLSFSELKDYREVASKTIELGIVVTTEINTFWNDFGDAVKKVLEVATDIGVRAAATAVKALILI
jgi:hypothetical protein